MQGVATKQHLMPALQHEPKGRLDNSSTAYSSAGAKLGGSERNPADIAACKRLVLMLALLEVSGRMRLSAMWRTSASLWATWPLRARA